MSRMPMAVAQGEQHRFTNSSCLAKSRYAKNPLDLLPNVRLEWDEKFQQMKSQNARLEHVGAATSAATSGSYRVVYRDQAGDSVSHEVRLPPWDRTSDKQRELYGQVKSRMWEQINSVASCTCGGRKVTGMPCAHEVFAATNLKRPEYSIIPLKHTATWYWQQMAEAGDYSLPGTAEIEASLGESKSDLLPPVYLANQAGQRKMHSKCSKISLQSPASKGHRQSARHRKQLQQQARARASRESWQESGLSDTDEDSNSE